eukprot:COSAG01_NODE_1786_length_9231_cov_19.575276_15_plen_103_part_00
MLFNISWCYTRGQTPVGERLRFLSCQGAAHLSSRSTLLLPKDAPPADFPFDAAGSPDATRGATPARTRMASATCGRSSIVFHDANVRVLKGLEHWHQPGLVH